MDQRRATRLRRPARHHEHGPPGLLSDLYFGFDTERLLLRLDARGGPFREQLADVEALRIVFFQPAGFELLVSQPGPTAARGPALRHDGVMAGPTPRRRPT